MEWNFILQGDEKQGMILIQDEGMDFHQVFQQFMGYILCLKGVGNRVCFLAWDRMEISYHYLCVVIVYS